MQVLDELFKGAHVESASLKQAAAPVKPAKTPALAGV